MTKRRYQRRLENLQFIEVRGRVKLAEDTSHLDVAGEEQTEDAEPLPEEQLSSESEKTDRKEYGLPRFVTLADGRRMDTHRSTARSLRKQLHSTCGSCGLEQPFNETLERLGHDAPIAAHAVQGYCPECDHDSQVYDGRFFARFTQRDERRLAASEQEWLARKEADLKDYWPRDEIAHSYMTHHANFALPRQGYTHWWKMFCSRQLLVHSVLLRAVCGTVGFSTEVRHQGLGAIDNNTCATRTALFSGTLNAIPPSHSSAILTTRPRRNL